MKIFLIITGSIIVILLSAAGYYGYFSNVEITEADKGPFTLVYEKYTGPYKDTGEIQNKIYNSLLNSDKVETFRGFGLYYDKPGEVEESKLRSIAGSILEEKDYNKIPVLQNKYKIKELPASRYIYAEFPFKDKMSILFSLMKVYPALNKYMTEKNLKGAPVMEVYDIPAKKIRYYIGINLDKEVFDSFLK